MEPSGTAPPTTNSSYLREAFCITIVISRQVCLRAQHYSSRRTGVFSSPQGHLPDCSNAQHRFVYYGTCRHKLVHHPVHHSFHTHITIYAALLHVLQVCAQCDKSLKSHSIQVSSTADCSQLSYVTSWVCGHTNAKILSSTPLGNAFSNSLDTGTEGGVR